jgi:hypothetical protein
VNQCDSAFTAQPVITLNMTLEGTMRRYLKFLAILLTVSMMYGCAGMSYTEQRMLSGGAIGAAGGAAIGAATGSAATGAAIGGAAGVVGGVIVDQYEKSQGRY